MNVFRINPLLIVLALTPAPLFASVVHDLYSASVPVSSQSQEARTEALHKALERVIVKVTGSRKALDDSHVAAIIAKPEHYLQTYRYKRHVPGENEPMSAASAPLDLAASFDRKALNKALRAADQPLWGTERPATIVWIAYRQEDGQRRVVGAEASGPVSAGVKQGAEARGVPIVFPLMDVKDRAHVEFSDVWGGFTSSVVQASRRYQPDAVLIGRINARGGSADSRWTLTANGRTTTWDGARGKPADVARAAIEHLAGLYASKFVIHPGSGTHDTSTLDIVVSDIDDLSSYGRVFKYLRALDALGNVEPTQIAGDTVTFRANAEGTIDGLKDTIALGAVLKPGKDKPTLSLPRPETSARPQALHFRYQP